MGSLAVLSQHLGCALHKCTSQGAPLTFKTFMCFLQQNSDRRQQNVPMKGMLGCLSGSLTQ